MTRVLAFGAFDPLHEGHIQFIKQAKALGDHLAVVVAHDSAIAAHKQRSARQSQEERIEAVKDLNIADEVIGGRETANKYHILTEVDFDVIALGYNQAPSEKVLREELNKIGKHHARIVRLEPYKPELFPED